MTFFAQYQSKLFHSFSPFLKIMRLKKPFVQEFSYSRMGLKNGKET